MKVNYVLLIGLLIVGALFVPAVSASDTIIEKHYVEYEDQTQTQSVVYQSMDASEKSVNQDLNFLLVKEIENVDQISYISLRIKSPNSPIPAGRSEMGYTVKNSNGITVKSGNVVIYKSYIRNILGTITHNDFLIFFQDWDNEGLTGRHTIEFAQPFTTGITRWTWKARSSGSSNICVGAFLPPAVNYAYLPTTGSTYHEWTINVVSASSWKTDLTVTNNIDSPTTHYDVALTRYSNPAVFTMYNAANATIFTDNTGNDVYTQVLQADISKITLISPTRTYTEILQTDPGDPGDPGTGETPNLRTGSVTMTDHNGTTITGFNVTAVNAYTGQEYTVSTETDVAVMTLPMDRTIRLRNPQTGEYEDAPVGYYKFYGNKTGYKMLNEDGIQISVLPEEYTSYQLCIILVTPESGPLTGKHQFQIRSRSDNSILQTGTISAKSATTGEWYNATVSGGIATLVLPYDTSNTQSQYAGNYYVYATSPGYYDSDYGTQIVVMPHTVSEIRYILLTPIGGVPTAGNVTLRIQAFSETGPGVVNAEIFIAGVLGAGSDVWNTYTASSTGYLAVSVPGNSTYDIVASAEGYYDSARRVEVFTDDPPLIEIKLYLSGPPTLEPTPQPTGWPTDHPTTQPTGGIPDEDDNSEGFLMQAVRGIGLAFGVGFSTAKLIFGMLLALSIGYATAKQLRGGAAEFGLGLLGGTLLGVLIGLLPVWIIVVLLLVVGLYIGNRYVGGANNG